MAAAMALTFIGPPKDHHLSGTPFAERTDLVLSQEGANALLRSHFFLDPVGAGDALVNLCGQTLQEYWQALLKNGLELFERRQVMRVDRHERHRHQRNAPFSGCLEDRNAHRLHKLPEAGWPDLGCCEGLT